MDFKQFLLGQSPDFKGRTIQDILDFTDEEIEQNHDFIQVVFPLDTPSQSSFHGHFLDNKDLIAELKETPEIKQSIRYLSKWFLSFLRRNDHWKSSYNHNYLRITRVNKLLKTFSWRQ